MMTFNFDKTFTKQGNEGTPEELERESQIIANVNNQDTIKNGYSTNFEYIFEYVKE